VPAAQQAVSTAGEPVTSTLPNAVLRRAPLCRDSCAREQIVEAGLSPEQHC
jgi:hypothetical protein